MAKVAKRRTLYLKPQGSNINTDVAVGSLQPVDAVRSQEVAFTEADSRVTEKSNFGGGFDKEAPQSGGSMGEVSFKVEAQSGGPVNLPEHELILRAAGFTSEVRAAVPASGSGANRIEAVPGAVVYTPNSSPERFGRLAAFCDGDGFVETAQRALASTLTIEGTIGNNLMYGATLKGNIKKNSNFTGTLPKAAYKTRDPILVVGGRCLISEVGNNNNVIRPRMESFSIDMGLSFTNVPDMNNPEGFAEGYITDRSTQITFTSLFDGATDFYDKFRANTDYTITFAFEGTGPDSGASARGSIYIIAKRCRMNNPPGHEDMSGLDGRSFTFMACGDGQNRDSEISIEFRGPLPASA